MRRALTAAIVTLSWAALPAGAAAQDDPPVFSEPNRDGPAGTEYKIPLEDARDNVDGDGPSSGEQAAGGADGSAGGPALFGRGIATQIESAIGDSRSAGESPEPGGSGAGETGFGGAADGGASDGSAIPAAGPGGADRGFAIAFSVGMLLAVLLAALLATRLLARSRRLKVD